MLPRAALSEWAGAAWAAQASRRSPGGLPPARRCQQALRGVPAHVVPALLFVLVAT